MTHEPGALDAVPPLYIHPRTMVTRRICAVVPQPMGLDRNWLTQPWRADLIPVHSPPTPQQLITDKIAYQPSSSRFLEGCGMV
jgi:hypothetical protein